MGQYATSNTGSLVVNPVLPAVLGPGDSVYLWGTSFVAGQPPTPGIIQAPNDANAQFEAVTVGERSLACNFQPRPGGGNAAGASIMVIANANPGVMEVDVQVSPMDADGAYLTPAATYKISVWTGPTGPKGYYFGWVELQPEGDFFMSLKCITNPNGVSLTAKVNYV